MENGESRMFEYRHHVKINGIIIFLIKKICMKLYDLREKRKYFCEADLLNYYFSRP